MENRETKIKNLVAEYYSSKIEQHGTTPAGVDWNGEESQNLRFDQLTKLIAIECDESFTLADFGCGYAAYHDYLSKVYPYHRYHGFDLSQEMCSAANDRLAASASAEIFCSGDLNSIFDYVVASGIFNVRLDVSEKEWFSYMISTVDKMHEHSRKGFSFNCLTSYSDIDKLKDHLYYASPMDIFDHCKRQYSKNVALLHDYDLYEFTILVRK